LHFFSLRDFSILFGSRLSVSLLLQPAGGAACVKREAGFSPARFPFYCISKTTRWLSGTKEAVADEEK